MRKVFLVSAVALAMTGCAVQQEHSAPQVRDLSVSRERAPASQYTVEAGDTLYGIAWRHDMDYRDLARLNQISPPTGSSQDSSCGWTKMVPPAPPAKHRASSAMRRSPRPLPWAVPTRLVIPTGCCPMTRPSSAVGA
ncbi:M23 family metallopeptidase [Halomonas sp. BC04]|uniref:M23 family metallopeptidase n=1 Tax=Halomonas sp. BC04 TaxID=1403540 RepID=UPI0003ED8349|nr:hypothetical protein Q427_22990 [Halomonas sp. BC04]